jgi:hypothetical protein
MERNSALMNIEVDQNSDVPSLFLSILLQSFMILR